LSDIQILVVDDSREMRDFVVEYVLKPNGFRTVEAIDGAAGVRRALQGDIDLILLDLEMPKMTGFEVIDALRDRRSETPIILMTSHGSEAIAVEVFRKGVRDYVIKPFTPDVMLEAIEQALREMRLQREKDALTKRLVQTNRQLEQHLRELNTLYQIGKSVTLLEERDRLLERVVEAALYISGAEEGAILLEDEDSGRLREHVCRRLIWDDQRRVPRRVEGGSAADGECQSDALSPGAMIQAPLKVGGKPIGALGVSNKVTARFFSDHDRRLLTALAGYAAVVVENAYLLRQLEQRDGQQVRLPDEGPSGGVRQIATVLIAGLHGLDNLDPRVAPEGLVKVLNYHLAVATQAMLAEQGTMDKSLGDGLAAYFNVPLMQPDHAMRAVRAAWRARRAIEQAHTHIPSPFRLWFGVGISTGDVLAGSIGVPHLANFTAVGDAVNVGRLLQERAAGGQVLISQRTYEQVRDHVGARPVGAVNVEGHAQPETVFEITSVRM
jgi:class 3 adenylate cyclase/DNA-binding response OmpR family regulator